ncbi:peptidoglycan-binding protein [Roseibium aggregatum]|uniref:SEL1-like repeat protein n=1 Tax=Roseibium aggregatum TaxID=187304 RepID=A0A939J0M6_9HYPH|nr:peptidoglycan-binding protein [Roseibium aggregatum]MBN9669448.1 SEL1-like repeat protein [Roseibium aggregatum]
MTKIHFARVYMAVLVGAVLSVSPHLPAAAEEPQGRVETSVEQAVTIASEAEKPSAGAGDDVPVQDCDRLAAAPLDPQAVTVGVRPEQIRAQEAIKACREAVRKFPESSRLLAQLGRSLHVAGDFDAAATWYKKAVDLGSLGAMNNLGCLKMNGLGVPRDPWKAVELFRRAAEKDFTIAMINLGNAHWRGIYAARGLRLARTWYRRAAERRNTQAMMLLGRMARYGYGKPLNAWEAANWVRRAALAGDAKAMEVLGSFYDNGFGVVQNEETAAKWHEAAAEAENIDATIAAAKAGNIQGMFIAAQALDEGRGVPVDREAATDWFKKVAESGNGEVMYTLAGRYRDGVGTEKDPVQAYEWFGRAAEADFTAAYYDLAAAYDSGHGVGRDPDAAAKMMLLALKDGNTTAERQMTTEADVWSSEFRRSLQRLLKVKGTYSGPIDGKFGPKTQRAIRLVKPL